jgi:hypothetical protein
MLPPNQLVTAILPAQSSPDEAPLQATCSTTLPGVHLGLLTNSQRIMAANNVSPDA